MREIIQHVITILVRQLAILERQIRTVVNAVMPSLLDLPGVDPIVAGVLLAEAGDPRRFASPHHFASYCGAAPVERGSGQNRRQASQSRRKSSLKLGSPYSLYNGRGPPADGRRSIEEALRQITERWQDQALCSPASQDLYRSRDISSATADTSLCSCFL